MRRLQLFLAGLAFYLANNCVAWWPSFHLRLQNVAYTSVTNGEVTGNTANGTGTIDDLLSMAPGASITYTVTAGILPSATGPLVNTAQVAAPQGVVDTNSGNNTATDRTQLTPQVDLRITKTDNRESTVPGLTQLTYTIVVTNDGPSAVSGAWVTDQLPDALQNVAYTSVTNGVVTGNTASGTGDIDDCCRWPRALRSRTR